jgi:archaellum component FlaC
MKKRVRKGKKVDTVEKLAILMEDGFSESRREMQVGFTAVSKRFDAIDEELRRIRSEIVDIHKRLDVLEEQGARQAGYSKEIDHILERVARIEKHIKLA